jgi:Uma2 family endonuclease
MTIEEYLASEERSSIRREYINGQVFAMSGVTNWHNLIAGNIYTVLRTHLRGSKCRAYMSDVKARVESMNCFYYPDVMVSCESYDRKTVYTDRPVLLVEVLSRSTASIDRREKMIAYKSLPSLKEYMIVHQSKQHVELHRRTGETTWDILEFTAGDEFELTSIPVGPLPVSVKAIYEDVNLGGDTQLQVREETLEYGEEEAGTLDW